MTDRTKIQRLLTVEDVSKVYGDTGGKFWAVRHASLAVERGECVAIVGESGSGKTTLARMIMGLVEPSEGNVRFDGEDVAALSRRRQDRQRLAARMQMVFQDPRSSLDPTMRIDNIIAEPLVIFGWSAADIANRVVEVLDLVGLSQDYAQRLPAELSGGQRQRVGIARALSPRPDLLLLDEPVASLDVSMQGQILRLLVDIKEKTNIAVVVIAHDLGVVRAIADRTVVMYSGRIVEHGSTGQVFGEPIHPYTAALYWSASVAGERAMTGDVRRALANEPLPAPQRVTGCVFRTRCWRKIDRCNVEAVRVDRNAGQVAWCNVPLAPPIPLRVSA
ncbi:MAG TPA: ABC transporter ATP-binding protein [Rhizobiaceae bacterium]|nr:ABC transporter ATP-binding protein [Rhizobiaceae bacterium]